MSSTLRRFVRRSGYCVLLLAFVCEVWELVTGQFESLSWLWIGALFCTVFIFLQESTEDSPPGHWVSLLVITWMLFVLSNGYQWTFQNAELITSDSWSLVAAVWSALFFYKEYRKDQTRKKRTHQP